MKFLNQVLVSDDDSEFLAIEELKPHQLTEIGVVSVQSQQQPDLPEASPHHHRHNHHQHQNSHNLQHQVDAVIDGGSFLQHEHVFYDLNAQQLANNNSVGSVCGADDDLNSIYLCSGDGAIRQTTAPENCHAVATVAAGTVLRTIETIVEQPSLAVTVSETTLNCVHTHGHSHPQHHQHHQHHHAHCSVSCVAAGQQQPQPQQPMQHQPMHHHQQQDQHQMVSHSANSRKRKSSYVETSDFEDDTGDDARSMRTTDENKKQNHSEIEKRRRDKMNTYITELSAMVPMCYNIGRKLDKLTVLRMCVQHLKSIRGTVHSYTEGHYKPTFLSDQELKMLILQAAEGFLFVVGCDRGRILYVSESVSQVLNYSQSDLLGQSWFDILHPKDIAKVKEQLSSSDLSPRERLIDAKTLLPVKTDVPQGMSRLCPGARRSFFCRMKHKNTPGLVKEETSEGTAGPRRTKKQQSADKKYSVIQCTGYLKSWPPAKIEMADHETDGDGELCNLSCLVAIGRIPPNISNKTVANEQSVNLTMKSIQFISRHAMDGKFLFVDQRATIVLGFLPQELLGTSMYEYYHHEDIPALAESHKTALQSTDNVITNVYRLRTKENSFMRMQSQWKSFRNPWTKDVEYLIGKNTVILSDCKIIESTPTRKEENGQTVDGFDFFSQTNGREINRIINTHVEASKIGRQIAEQVLDYQRHGRSSSESSPDPDSVLYGQHLPSVKCKSDEGGESSGGGEGAGVGHNNDPHHQHQNPHPSTVTTNSRPNSVLSSNAQEPLRSVLSISSPDATNAEMLRIIDDSGLPEVTSECNDEAAMAVIMSLLEADAGLGGPVDFTGLPWPLP